MDIQLNFINRSNDKNNSQIVIFQKNVNTDFGELAVAWQVIENCGQGDNHPFVFPMTMSVGALDSHGNYTQQKQADNGQLFTMQNTLSGNQLNVADIDTNPSMTEVHVLNGLEKGAITTSIYKAGKLLATKTSVVPQQKAVFQFKPTIWIGVASQIVEGDVMNSAIISNINTELPLLGIASANIVMTGGGPGASSTPFRFALDNIVMA
jgi:hypothetical protein